MKLCLVSISIHNSNQIYRLIHTNSETYLHFNIFTFLITQLAVVLVAGVLAEPEPESKPWYGYGGYGYGGYGGYWGRKRRDADSNAVAEPEAKPWYYYGYPAYGYHYIGKRSADAQPESNPWYGYGGWGGYGGYYWG